MLEHHITPEEPDILYQDSIKNEKGGVLMKGIRTTNDSYMWVSQQEKQNEKQSKKLHTMLEHHEMSEELVSLHFESINDMRSVSDSCSSKKSNVVSLTHEKQSGDSCVRIMKGKQFDESEGKSEFFLSKKLEQYTERVCYQSPVHANSGPLSK